MYLKKTFALYNVYFTLMFFAFIAILYLNIELLTHNTRFENKSIEISSTILSIIGFSYLLYKDSIREKKQ